MYSYSKPYFFGISNAREAAAHAADCSCFFSSAPIVSLPYSGSSRSSGYPQRFLVIHRSFALIHKQYFKNVDNFFAFCKNIRRKYELLIVFSGKMWTTHNKYLSSIEIKEKLSTAKLCDFSVKSNDIPPFLSCYSKSRLNAIEYVPYVKTRLTFPRAPLRFR